LKELVRKNLWEDMNIYKTKAIVLIPYRMKESTCGMMGKI
jgi:hypothetical protein